MSFVHLHCHSSFSFYAGTASVRELVARAKTLGMDALALTDTNRMSGLIRFYTECRAQGIQPILGVELTEPSRPFENMVLLAKNAEGYADICEIITERQTAEHFSFERVFARHWPNLVLFTGFPRLFSLLAATPNRANLYAELVNTSPASRERSRQMEVLATELGIPLMVSNDAYFLHKEEWETHKVLRAIGLTSTLSRLNSAEYAPENAFFCSSSHMERLFPRHAQVIANTQRIAGQCTAELKLGEWILPNITVPEGFTPDSYLRTLACAGLQKNYGNTPVCARAQELQEQELAIISKLGYSSYFLMVKQVRDWANRTFATRYRRERDCTIMRGSAANSLTFYNIGASDLDPIRYNLYFQRFLNEDRASPPDADLDFGWDERERVQDYFFDTWGSRRVALLCTFNCFRMRAAFREAAKVFGYSEEQVSALVKKGRAGISIDAICYHYTYDGIAPGDPEVERLLAIAAKLEGKPRFLGQHPGGIIVTNGPLCRCVACEYPGAEKRRVVTQVDMHSGIDDLGLIKFDILGNGSLSVLRDTLCQLEEQRLADPEVWDLEKCYGDPAVRSLMRSGKTRGIFYIESPAQIRLNQQAQAESFEDITVTSSLVRPAGAAYTGLYVERHRKAQQGIRDWEFLHPALAPILGETYDVCAFQEDVTKICRQVAGMSYRTADKIRKRMNSVHEGAPATGEWLHVAQEFMEGCRVTSGLSRAQALELWERVNSFSGFSFCKSHSASYAQLSFKCAFLKCRYPAQFLAAVISNNHGFYTRDVYLDEARRCGLRLLHMDINESAVKYAGKHDWIRPGLMHVRGVSRASLTRIMDERAQNGRFFNLLDFIQRVAVHQKELEHLIQVGAFDLFGLTQPELLSLLHGAYKKLRPDVPGFFDADAGVRAAEFHPGLRDYTLAEHCLNEQRLLGYMLSGNMLDILDLHPAARNAVPAVELPRYARRRVKFFGKPISARLHMVAKSNRLMKFVTMEDRTGCIDAIFWPEAYEQFADTVNGEGPFEIWGTVAEEWGAFTIQADRIRNVSWSPNQVDLAAAEQRLARSFERYAQYDSMHVRRAA